MGIEGIEAWELLKAGGPVMIPIVLCSIFALGIVIEKLIFFSSIRTDIHHLKEGVFSLIKNNKLKQAIETCDNNPSPVAKILKAGIVKFGSSREEIKEAMEDISLFEIPKLEKHLTALTTIANISPLLGLLGTVIGMTTVFYTIHIRAASMNPVTPADLAGGIWQALLTTAAGLMVAIPAFVAYNYCVSRVNAVVLDMERVATELVNFLCHISESGAVSFDR